MARREMSVMQYSLSLIMIINNIVCNVFSIIFYLSESLNGNTEENKSCESQ